METSETPVRAKAKKRATTTPPSEPPTRLLAKIGNCEPENLESLRKGVQLAIESAMLKMQRELAQVEHGGGPDPSRMRALAKDLRAAWGMVAALRGEVALLQRELEAGTRPSTRLVLVEGGAS